MNWNPTTDEEIAQNVRSIVATAQGSQPLARELGVADLVDAPLPVVEARVASGLAKQIKTYEPRANVKRIAVEQAADGRIVPTVRLQ